MRNRFHLFTLCGLAIAGLALPGRPLSAAQIFNDNVLWFRADAGVLNSSALPASDGQSVAAWQNQGNPALHVEQATVGKQPTFVEFSSLNGMPAVSFDNTGGSGGADSLSNTTANPLANSDARTMLVAGRAGPTSEGGALLTYRRSTLVHVDQLGNLSGTFYVYTDGVSGANNSTIPNPGNATRNEIRDPFVSVHKSTPGTSPTLTPIGVDLNGTLRTVSTGGGGVSLETGLTGFTLGGRLDQPSGSFDWNGLIAEVLVYNRLLNSAETIIASNYLSSKYGTTLAPSVDRYQGDTPANNHYDFEVFGIGQAAAMANGAPAGAVSSGTAGTGLMLAAASAMTNGDFVLAGQRAGANALTTSDVPVGWTERWSRVWYVEQTGIADTTLTFDFSDAGLSMPTQEGTTFALLYSETDPFNFSLLSELFTVAGDQVSFTLTADQLANGYYTIVIGLVPEPSSVWLMLGLLGCVGTRQARRRARPGQAAHGS